MKKIIFLMVLSAASLFSKNLNAQSIDVQELILDAEKLAELKNILSEMNQGYQILSTGYENIRSIAEGNFNLHKTFLDALLAVNPAVKNDQRVSAIIAGQTAILTEYKTAFTQFKQDGNFSADELSYVSLVYQHLISATADNSTALASVLTPNVMRMSDEERLHAIDGIYASTRDQLMFLRQFNNGATLLAAQRAAAHQDAATLQQIYGLK